MSKLLVLGFLLAPFAFADHQNSALAFCQSRVLNGGYKSGLEEGRCEASFDLPSPFLLKCLRQQEAGQLSKECEWYRRNNVNWGPWSDFELPVNLAEQLSQFRATESAQL
jgi:hypothetical protein